MSKLAHTAWLIVALAVGFGVYGWQQRKLGAQNALAKEAAAKLDTLIQIQQVKDAAHARQDSAAQVKISALTLAGKTLQVKAAQLNARADSLVALDSLKPAVEMLRNVISADSVIISQQAQALALVSGRWQAADSSRNVWRGLALDAQAQLKQSLKRSTPKFGCFVGPGLSVGLGHGAGATVGCGLRIG